MQSSPPGVGPGSERSRLAPAPSSLGDFRVSPLGFQRRDHRCPGGTARIWRYAGPRQIETSTEICNTDGPATGKPCFPRFRRIVPYLAEPFLTGPSETRHGTDTIPHFRWISRYLRETACECIMHRARSPSQIFADNKSARAQHTRYAGSRRSARRIGCGLWSWRLLLLFFSDSDPGMLTRVALSNEFLRFDGNILTLSGPIDSRISNELSFPAGTDVSTANEWVCGH